MYLSSDSIRTVKEAISAGYEQMPDFYIHPLGLDHLEETVSRIDGKLYEILLSGELILKQHDSILRYSFIIVAQEFGYCLWRRSIMGDK